jgi:hypothetical protein
MENKQWIWDNGILKEVEIAKHQEIIKESSKKNLEENMIQVFKDFISKL